MNDVPESPRQTSVTPSGAERRRTARREESVPVSVVLNGPITLTGTTIDRSSGGLLLHTRGRIPVVISLGERRFSGRLVRAVPHDRDTIAIALELEEFIGLETDEATPLE